MTKSNREWKGYVSVNLTKAQRKEIDDLANDPDALWEMFYILSKRGQRVSVDYDTKNDCFRGTMSGYNDSENLGYAITTRAKTAIKAIAGCVYKAGSYYRAGKWVTNDSGVDIL